MERVWIGRNFVVFSTHIFLDFNLACTCNFSSNLFPSSHLIVRISGIKNKVSLYRVVAQHFTTSKETNKISTELFHNIFCSTITKPPTNTLDSSKNSIKLNQLN